MTTCVGELALDRPCHPVLRCRLPPGFFRPQAHPCKHDITRHTERGIPVAERGDGNASESGERLSAGLSTLRLSELLREVTDRLTEIAASRDQLHGLLDAVVAVASGLELSSTLRRIAAAAVTLVDAQYGALGVIAPDRSLQEFVHNGIDEPTRQRIGHLPEGHGILGLLIDDPRPVRLQDRRSPLVVRVPPHHPEHLPRGADPGPRRGLRQPLPHREA